MKILFFSLLTILISTGTSAQEEKKNIVYKYKEYESIDLGALEIKGQIMAPGDLTVNERARTEF